jgi:predicted nucleic acid-binding protein
MTVVIDTNVFLAAAFWKGAARKCWALCASRHYDIAVTTEILEEYRHKAQVLGQRFAQVEPNPFLRWIENECPRFLPSPLGKQRSRDASDDMFLASTGQPGELPDYARPRSMASAAARKRHHDILLA